VIHTRADKSIECTVWIKTWSTKEQYPSVYAVIPLQTALHSKRLSGFYAPSKGLKARLSVVGVYAIEPSKPLSLLKSQAPEIKPSLIEISTLLVLTRRPDHNRREAGSYLRFFLYVVTHARPGRVRAVTSGYGEVRRGGTSFGEAASG